MVNPGTAGHVYLSVGDGATTDYVALLSSDNPFCYLTKNGFHAPPPSPGDITRTVTLTLNLTGRDANELWDNYRKLETKLRQARAAQGPYGLGPGVTLGVRFDAQNTMVFFDVLDGLITTDQNLTNLFPIPFIENVSLQLICLPYARGIPVSDAVSSTITNGTAATLYRAQVPGDVPALARLTLTDVSTNSKIINRWRIGQVALPSMQSGDVNPILDATAVSPGTATTDSSSYLGASFSRITTTSSWQTIAKVAKPAAQYMTGLYDVWVRARDAADRITEPQNLTANAGAVGFLHRTDKFSATTLLQPTWPSATTTGNLLIAVFSWSSGTLTIPLPWTLAKSQAGSGSAHNLAIYYIANAASRSGAESFTVSVAGSFAVTMWELTGIATSSPLDQATSNAASSSSTWAPGTTSTLAQAHELAFLAMTYATGNGPATPTNWTALGGSGALSYSLETSATTALNPSAGFSSGSNDWTAVLVTFKCLTTSAPNLSAGSYTLQVTALDADGNESLPSTATSLVLPALGAIRLDWDVPAFGTAANYNVYFDNGSGFSFFATGSSTPTYTLGTTIGASPGAPGLGNSSLSALRAQIGLSSGTILINQPEFLCQLGGSSWEMVYVGTLDLPPQVARDGGTPPDWLLQLQGQRAGTSVTLDVDGVWLIPHLWTSIETTYNDGSGTVMNLATKRAWVIDTRRDGRTSVRLHATADGSEAGQAITTGALFVGPGDTTLIFMPDITGGASDVTDAKFTAQLTITPRYSLVSGILL